MIKQAVSKIRLAVVMVFGIVMAMFVSCSSPRSVEFFVPVSEADSTGRLEFVLDMSDSTKTFDVSFFTRVDSHETTFNSITEFPLQVDWFSPEQKHYTETVYLPLDRFEGADSFVHDVCVEYRKGLVPNRYGMWKMYVTPLPIEGLRGIGIILKNNDR